jgi:uracil-DNA glycosylase
MPDSASENEQTPRDRVKRLIDSFEAYVRAEKEQGAETVPATPALVAALANPIPRPPATRKARHPATPGPPHPRPDLVFVWGDPVADDAANQLLTKMIVAMGYARDDVVVTARVDDPIEKQNPKIIVTLGEAALKQLLGPESAPLAKIQGQWLAYKGIDVMPTFHPSYLLSTPEAKKEAWTDLKAVLKKLGRTPPGKK